MADETPAASQEAAAQDDSDFDAAFAEYAGQAANETGTHDDPPADDAGASKGDAGDAGEGPEKATQPTETDPDPKAEETAPDPWSDATPEQRAAYEAAQQTLDRERHENRSNRQRMSTLTRRVNELEAQLREAAAKPAASAKDAADPQAGGTPDAIAALAKMEEDYPEIAKPVADAFRAMQAQFQATQERLDAAQRELGGISDAHRQTILHRQEQIVLERHPDVVDVIRSSDFRQWLDSQPPFIQQAAERNGKAIVDGEEAAHVVTLFKTSRGQTTTQPAQTGAQPQDQTPNRTTRQQRQLEAATSVSARGPGAASGPPDDFDSSFDYYARRA